MEQLLLHLFGDYITQSNWMAKNKASSTLAAAVHAWVYSLPFLLLNPSLVALAVIAVSHFAIDRWRLARYVVFAKNWLNQPSIRWEDHQTTGYHKDSPIWMSVWLLIVADNTLHLCINYAALRWF